MDDFLNAQSDKIFFFNFTQPGPLGVSAPKVQIFDYRRRRVDLIDKMNFRQKDVYIILAQIALFGTF